MKRALDSAVVLLLACSLVSTQEAELASSSDLTAWNQPRGTASGSGLLAFEPVRSTPVEEWRVHFGEILSNPVQWGGYVYAVVLDGRERKLVAIDLESGATDAVERLAKGGRAYLGAWNGQIVLLDHDNVRLFSHTSGDLRGGKRLKGGYRLPPAVHEGTLFVADGTLLTAIELEGLSVIGTAEGGEGRPAVHGLGEEVSIATFTVGPRSGYRGNFVRLFIARGHGLGTRAASVVDGRRNWLGNAGNTRIAEEGYAAYCGVVDGEYEPRWFIRSHFTLPSARGGRSGSAMANGDEGHVAPIVTDAVIYERQAYGFSEEGALLRFDVDGSVIEVIPNGALPEGGRPGMGSGSQEVLYFGNWALDGSSGRVLWCEPSIDPNGPLMPMGDGRLVYQQGRSLVGLLDPRMASRRTATSVLAGTAGGAVRPDVGAVVIRTDGSVLAGTVEFPAQGGARVESEEKTVIEVVEDDIAFAQSSGGTKKVGSQFPVYAAWRSVLHEEHLAALDELILLYASERHVDDAQRLMTEAARYGLGMERRKELDALLSGKRERSDATVEAKLAKKHAQETEKRAVVQRSYLRAAEWCKERGMTVAASVILSDVHDVAAGDEPDEALALARSTMPREFPWPDDVRRWMRWSQDLLPADGRFLAREDAAWKRLPDDWRQGAIGLRTPNLLLFSMESDPTVIGKALRKGEGTVRALESLLGRAAFASDDPLEIRVFQDRQSYLDAQDGVPFWSAGYYAPSEDVSRFYVPRGERDDPEERELHYVLAHEITHHWIDLRWAEEAKSRTTTPGFWIVEGFARFLEDQFLELGRVDRGFADPTVKSVDTVVQVWKARRLLDFGRLVDMSQADFALLNDLPISEQPVTLRYTTGARFLTQRGLFYDQAGALVYYLMNECGEEGRTALIDYMRAYYAGESQRSGWKALGFESSTLLERAFEEFLGSVY